MDTQRGNFDGFDGAYGDDAIDDELEHDAPPPQIGADERRMQVRAYNFWASLLDNRNFPNVEDLDPQKLPDFGPHGVLLDFSHGVEDPAIAFLGSELAGECGANGMVINRLSDVPSRSLLSRITDHYMQILANQAPIGFEAEFVNQRGVTILYRGILLPFSSDDETIDFIFGAINWKEMADSKDADELLLEIDQALERSGVRSRSPEAPMADWADGPGSMTGGTGFAAPEMDDLPRPSFGLDLTSHAAASDGTNERDTADMGLADWLAAARELAQTACSSEDRTRKALYDAIGRAYDFALAAAQEPGEFAEMLEDAGLAMQQRAPMTPVVKLVFGADYDKTRLTEYAAALTHAQRIGLERGALGSFLRAADGGLKGVVQAERRLRRQDGDTRAAVQTGPRKALARKLRAIQPRQLSAIGTQGEEFALVMVRRTDDGDVVLLGEVPEDNALIEKAARKLIG
ncbi:hypothetical protein GCM10009127_02160 [Alteraurantiacibacter aestuarii]|uniref:Uncharacterized protein n=1 Tax=Alteraurantiacibacter aestuarii TaxID=650004 RepID=A0A844ZNC5_9SPHN|nr:hypothetical protein [Alteraurantiacibacter aestuarii]MXO88530.1 hypothetical protein [Alteraurantiacibacter aestuarii]